ncbi:MAG: spore germination protein [Oscillospiraceae bacterium]|jgi:spore germination protein KA|nr:spore germination protein [Oscillospiraceae bacterium]
MIGFLKKLIDVNQKSEAENSEEEIEKYEPLEPSLENKIFNLRKKFNQSSDLVVQKFKIDDTEVAIVNMDGLIDKKSLAISVINPIRRYGSIKIKDAVKKYQFIKNNILSYADQVEISDYKNFVAFVTSGSAMLLIDGCSKVLAIGIQGYNFRGIAEPVNEVMQHESKEGFTEPLRINATMIRRRIRNTRLKFESMSIGSITKTDLYLCYLVGSCSENLVKKIKERLKKINIEGIIAAGYLSEFLEENQNISLFSSVGTSERPDTVCAKILEGKVAILIDGTPTVLLVPYLFTEFFQTLDDYTTKPYFASLNRWLKYLAFFIATLLPGIYVATCTFNPELLPNQLINKIAISTATTPFSLVFETFIIHLVYEIMREAGLRLPKPLGHAISIVGGLVIGQTAVSSGLIGGPTLFVVALTALSSYVIPNLYEPIAVLKLVFILVGGFLGTWAIMILFSVVLVDICSKENFGVPYASPISPFGWFGMRDVFIRSGWKTLSKKQTKLENLPGSKI